MAQVVDNLGDNKLGIALHWWQRWATWIGYATSLWCVVYGELGLYWTQGGAWSERRSPAAGFGTPGGRLLLAGRLRHEGEPARM